MRTKPWKEPVQRRLGGRGICICPGHQLYACLYVSQSRQSQ